MYIPKSQYRLIITMFMVGLSTSLAAQDADQAGWTEAKEKWGQLLFCQQIYKMPEVQSRLYSFDIDQCDKAGQLVAKRVAKYPGGEQKQLQYQAEQHAVRLSRYTSEPYQSVPACREYCSGLVETLDKSSD